MHFRGPPAPRRHFLRALALRTALATIAAGLLSALVVSLIRSGGIQQKAVRNVIVVDTTILADPGSGGVGIERLVSESHTTQKSQQLNLDQQRARPLPGRKGGPKTKDIYATDAFRAQLKAQAEEPRGRVPRLQQSLEEPLGAKIEGKGPLCWPFKNATQSVAVVGNGPLSEADRRSVESHQVVVRFNLMNNWQRFRERLDVWVMRFSSEATAGYWGINNISKNETLRILQTLSGAWLVGGSQAHADKLLGNHPELERHHPVLLPEAAMNKAFAADVLDSPASYPSTGFVGIQAVLHCTQPNTRMHVYGFNWSKKTWSGHNVSAEREYIRGLEAAGRAVVHPTACSGMRECGEGDIDASCHWSTDGKYMCLRGKPRHWVDKTASVHDERQREFRTDVSGPGLSLSAI